MSSFWPTQKGWTPLHIACAMNHTAVANLFLEYKSKNLIGVTLLKKLIKANNNLELLEKIEKIAPSKKLFLHFRQPSSQLIQPKEPHIEKDIHLKNK